VDPGPKLVFYSIKFTGYSKALIPQKEFIPLVLKILSDSLRNRERENMC
jgi:hypothetical protein